MSLSTRTLLVATVLLLTIHGSRSAIAQSISLITTVAYLDTTTTPPTPRVTLGGVVTSTLVNGQTYQYVGVVLSNFQSSTANVPPTPSAQSPGTTFGYGENSINLSGISAASVWKADIPLPVAITTDPSNPTYITLSMYLVDAEGHPYNDGVGDGVFSNYCFMTYIASEKVITSPTGGPYYGIFAVPGAAVKTESNAKAAPVAAGSTSAKARTKAGRFPAPKSRKANLQGFWEGRPTPLLREIAHVKRSGLSAMA